VVAAQRRGDAEAVAARLKTKGISAKEDSTREKGAVMLVVDAQIHIWRNNKPTNANHRQVTDFTPPTS